MNLLTPLHTIVPVHLFWFSIVFIGTMLLYCLSSTKRLRGEINHIWAMPLFVKFLIVSALGMAVFGTYTIIGYVLHMPSWWLAVSYLLSLSVSLYICFIYRVRIWADIAKITRQTRRLKLISVWTLLIMFLIIDYIVSLYIGGFISADTYIHVSKIRALAESGFYLTDAFFNTVPETRHHVSVIHMLYAIPTWFGIDAFNVWYSSLAFFRLVKWAAIFMLALYVFKSIKQTEHNASLYAVLAVCASTSLYGNYWLNITAHLATIWIMLFIVGLFYLFNEKRFTLLVISSVLIALTHSLTAMITVTLLMLVVSAFAIFNRKVFTKRTVLAILVSFVSLSASVTLTALLPNRMTSDAANIYSDLMATKEYIPGVFGVIPDIGMIFSGVYRHSITPLLLALAIVGALGMMLLVKNRNQKIIIVSLWIFAPLILVNPITYTILGKLLPSWGSLRFYYENQLEAIAPIVGAVLLGIVIRRTNRRAAICVQVVIVLLLLVANFTMMRLGVHDNAFGEGSLYYNQAMQYQEVDAMRNMLPDDQGQVILASLHDSFYVASASSNLAVAIPDGNAPPAADVDQRIACQKYLYGALDLGMMKQVQVRYVLIEHGSAQQKILQGNDRFILLKSDGVRDLYLFNSQGVKSTNNKVCQFNEG